MATTPNLGLPLIDGAMTADVPRDMNALANAVDTAVEEALADVSIPDASLTVKGKTQLSSATDSALEDRAATPKAVNDARVAAISAAATAETNAKNASLPRTGGTINGGLLINAPGALGTAAGSVIDSSIENFNVGNITGLVTRVTRVSTGTTWETAALELLRRTDTTNQAVLRFEGDDIKFQDAGGVWTSLRDLKQSGVSAKQGIVDAINAKGGSASTSDSWATLSAKINAINTGKRFAAGQFTLNSSGQGSVGGLAFTPRNITINDAVYPTGVGSTYFGAYSADAYTLKDGAQAPLNEIRGKNNGTTVTDAITILSNGFSINAPTVTNGRTYNYFATE